jgi:hypothetical protein
MAKYIIVSRHPAAVEFIREEMPELTDAEVFASVTAQDVEGKVVVGNLPLSMACLAAEVIAVEFEGAPPRGQEYGVEDMRAAGAKLARYRVLGEAAVEGLKAEVNGLLFEAGGMTTPDEVNERLEKHL